MANRQQAPGRTVLPRLVPVALLVILALAGLRGAVATPRWDGPLHQDGPQVGVALEVLLAALLVITVVRGARLRRQAGDELAVARKLRVLLLIVLTSGMIAIAVLLIANLHGHLFRTVPGHPPPPVRRRLPRHLRLPGQSTSPTVHINLLDVGYGLLIVILLAAIAATVLWSRRHRHGGPGAFGTDPDDEPDAAELRAAVESGAAALRSIDDARAAIIACYVAMERTLGDRGTERNAADTPDELLTRAVASGLARGQAASTLTALFYEARFSSHPLDDGKRDAAELALADLASELVGP